MALYSSLTRPLLFRLSGDQAHELARLALRWPLLWAMVGRRYRVENDRLATNLAGVPLPNPIGLAPGFDKHGELLLSLAQLGFGYLTPGSITRQPRAGNPLPRLLRYPDQLSIGNCMGLPSAGMNAAVRSLKRSRGVKTPIIASVAGFSVEELVELASAVEPYVAAVEIGLICRNTDEGMQQLGELAIFTELIEQLRRRQRKPVIMKLPPHHDQADQRRVRAMVDACLQAGVEGVSVSGTRHIQEPRLSMGAGGLAGRAVFNDALRIVRDVAEWSCGKLAIKAAGGVFTGEDAYQLLHAGATTIEVYSAFIYRGWEVASHIKSELLAILDREGLHSVRQIRPLMLA